jgi:hypothetical protein
MLRFKKFPLGVNYYFFSILPFERWINLVR